MTNRECRIGLVQLRCRADADQNHEAAVAGTRSAVQQGADVVCLPELFSHLYFCQTEDHQNFRLAEPVPGPTTDLLSSLARELGVVIVASVFEERAPGIYHNTAVVLNDDGELLGKYRKMHIPDDPLYYEKFYFTPGDLGFQSFDCRIGRIGVLICWDQWFPEAARLTALQGAQILFYPTAIGWFPSEKADFGPAQHESWELIQRSHAVANGCFVAAVNRTGHEGDPDGGIEFWGQSFVADPTGQILARASATEPEVMVVRLNLEQVAESRTQWPFLRDRRIDAYGDLTRRYVDD